MRPAIFYLEQNVTVVKRWTIEDEDVKTEADAIAFVEDNMPDADESEETDWDDIIIVESESGRYDYRAEIVVNFEAPSMTAAEDFAQQMCNAAENVRESECSILECEVRNLIEE